MSGLKCKFREFIAIIEAHGFEEIRQPATSHRRYRGLVDGAVCHVTVAGHPNDDINPDTLASMIRQSGLPKKLFRK